MEKECASCHRWLPAIAYRQNRATSDGLQSWCRECFRRYNRKHAYKRRGQLKRYGLTAGGYAALHDAQDGRCAICGREYTTRTNTAAHVLDVDHDHQTGAVRGLLCFRCNAGLGHFGDAPHLLRAAAAYLEAGADHRQIRRLFQPM